MRGAASLPRMTSSSVATWPSPTRWPPTWRCSAASRRSRAPCSSASTRTKSIKSAPSRRSPTCSRDSPGLRPGMTLEPESGCGRHRQPAGPGRVGAARQPAGGAGRLRSCPRTKHCSASKTRSRPGAGPRLARFPNFSVEMETGTGKTYVYLRTALELFQRYGLRKFIVVVPSIAIREGVLKTLQVTERALARALRQRAVPLLRLRLGQPHPGAPVRHVRWGRDHGHDHRRLQQGLERHPPEHRPPPGRDARSLRAGVAAHPHPRRAAEHGERAAHQGARRARPALRPALQRHAPQPLQPRLPAHARTRPTSSGW